jgi:hypothetical protein
VPEASERENTDRSCASCALARLLSLAMPEPRDRVNALARAAGRSYDVQVHEASTAYI